jgi:hypothetical protein
VGWLMNLLKQMLPSRFIYYPLENMPQDEAVEMVYKYSQFFDTPVTEETAYLIAEMAEGNPLYISSIFRSLHKQKDLCTARGLKEILEFETLNNRGNIKLSWMEYVNTAFSKVNDRNVKRIVLHLFKYKDRELTREEILNELKLDMTDEELEIQKIKNIIIQWRQEILKRKCWECDIWYMCTFCFASKSKRDNFVIKKKDCLQLEKNLNRNLKDYLEIKEKEDEEKNSFIGSNMAAFLDAL